MSCGLFLDPESYYESGMDFAMHDNYFHALNPLKGKVILNKNKNLRGL